MSLSEPSSDTHDNTSVVSDSSTSISDEGYVYHEGFPHNFFESDDALQNLNNAAYDSISVAKNLRAEAQEQMIFFNAQIDHLMANRDSLEDQKARHLLDVGRGVMVRAFQILFPVAYRDNEVYYLSESDGRKRAVNWIGFRKLVHAHSVLLENKVLPEGSRLADRQGVILREHSVAAYDLYLAKRTRSLSKGTEASNGNAHAKETFLFFLPLVKAKFATTKKEFEEAEEYAIRVCSKDARDKGITSNDYWALLPHTIQRVERELQEQREVLKSLEESASITNEAPGALRDMPNTEENQRSRSLSDAKPTFPTSANDSGAVMSPSDDPSSGIRLARITVYTLISSLDMMRKTKHYLETKESEYFYVGAAIQIMENGDLLDLILGLYYGLAIPPNGLTILR